MTKKAHFAVAATGFALLALFLMNKKTAPAPDLTPGDARKALPARMANPPKPALANLPSLNGSEEQGTKNAEQETNAPPATANTAGLLSEETLEPLRRAFAPPRFTENPAVPHMRQTLLSNRLIVSPEARSIPQAASGQQSPTPRGTTPFIVQFNIPVSDAARELLTDAGALVRGFFPNNAVLAELDPAALAALQNVAQAQAADEFLPSDKIQPFLSSLLATHPQASKVRMTLQTFAPEDAGTVAAAVRKAGGEVEEASAGTRWGTIRAVLALGAVREFAALGAVQWIEECPQVQRRNDKAAITSHLNTAHAWDTWSLTGKGQVAGHADTGLDTGDLATMHPDFQGRIRALIARGRPGDASDLNGHGTHTAGSLLGSGAASGGRYRGMAWEAELVHQSVVNASDTFTGLPADLYLFFMESYALGALIHSDSWGSSTYGSYNNNCRATDLFAWDHPDHLAVFSAGNDGRDLNRDGRVDADSISSPATAKNVLCVGATENDRPAGSGGISSLTWGLAWSADYPVSPIRNDLISYSATPSPVYRQGMAAFSSRGPTDDGRIKPDVVAPGTDVISAKSALGGNAWGALSGNPRYCFNGGTSMATPLVAGCATLVRQYCVERAGITNPSAALLKAMLVGGAHSLAPGQYGTGNTQEIPFASPNTVEGWGQPDIADTVHPTNRMIRLFDRIGPASGATNTFDVTVAVSNTPLDIALCWMDYPATAGAGITRVNDLDVLVVAPDGTRLYPNGGAARDTLNTVETVRVPSAQAGVYRIHVIGAAVPYAGGAAALYVRGAFEAPPVIVHTPLPAQTVGFAPYAVTFRVQSLAPLTNGEARVFWRAEAGAQMSRASAAGLRAPLSGAPLSGALWQEAAAVWVTNAEYLAEIPAQPRETTVFYYVTVTSGVHTAALPADAPASALAFYTDNAVELTVDGLPDRYGTVSPPYGTGAQIANVPFAASASGTVAAGSGSRRVCAGWSGTGDIPPHGETNAATFVIGQPSTLTWNWETEYALTHRYRLADTGQLFSETVTWHRQGALASTETAPEFGFITGSTLYAFCGWSVDGSRWPDATSSAPNPATGIVMNAPRLVQGDYLPFWRDTDGDGMSDWWERRHFGSATDALHAAGDDPDNDTWTNLSEFLDNTDPNDPASVPAPPQIDLTPLAAFQTERPPWTVTATVTDSMSVEEAWLVWREKDEINWHITPMTWVADTDTYTAELAPPSHGAKRTDYYIHAADLLGLSLPDFVSVSPTYSVIGDYETPWLEVTPESLDLLELSDAATHLAFTVSNLAGPDLVWTARVAAAAAPFAPAHTAWSHSGNNDAWRVTTNRTWNGDAVWYCGDPATRTYPNGCHAALDTPPFTVGAGGGLLFRQWLKTEYDADTHYWDGAVIRISTDGGGSFTLIEPVSGYPCQITENPDSPFAAHHPCLAGKGTGWETLLLDLSAYAGQSVIVRFEFGSDLFVIDEGWYIAGVTPFSLDEHAPWLVPSGTWGGVLPGTKSAPVSATVDPTAIAYDEEAAACLRIDSNDPSATPLIPLTLRRGHRLFLSANGPGTVTADRTFLFRGAQATVTLQADPGCYLYCVLLNGVPEPGVYSYATVKKSFSFSALSSDLTLDAWFSPKFYELTVFSPEERIYPTNGVYTLAHGTTVNAFAVFPEIPFVGPFAETARRRCTGWTLTGHTPASGSGAALSFTFTNNAVLSWNWLNEFRLTTQAGPDGTVAPSNSWYEPGSTAVVTAYPSAYHHLGGWGGDLSESTLDGPRLSTVMTLPHTVSVSFAPNLTATRGVPEFWLAQYGWTHDFEAAAEADADADGMPAWAEWRADTDPTNARSRLAVIALSPSADGWRLVWTGGRSRTQEVQRADSLVGPWISVHTNLPPTATTNTVTLPGGAGWPPSAPSGFFRIAVP
jgi:hypothetical protein